MIINQLKARLLRKHNLILFMTLLIGSCSSFNKRGNIKNSNVDFNKMWNYSNPVETRGKFTDLLEKDLKKDLDYILQLRTQIARTHSLKAEFSEAHKILDIVEKELDDSTVVAKVRYLLERGRTYNSAGNKEKAKELFEKAFDLSNKYKLDNYTIDAAHMVAIAAGDLDEKVRWSEKGIQIAKDSADESVKRWIGIFYNNSGWDLFEVKRYTEALEKFIKCEEFHLEMKNESNLAIARWSIAKTYRYLGRVEESLAIQNELLHESGDKDDSGHTYEELAELYLLKGEKEKAKHYFLKTHKILSKDVWLQKNESDRLERISRLAK